jgi:carbamoyl-phosphate synthase small subunit
MSGVDTRDLTLHLRESGTLRGFCTTGIEDPEEAVDRARRVPLISEQDLVSDVTGQTRAAREQAGGSMAAVEGPKRSDPAPKQDGDAPRPRIVVIDYGVKESILHELRRHGCEIDLVTADATPEAIDRLGPDGIVLSNGPGDPRALNPLLGTVRHCIEHYPTLAICLGHQLAGLALGAKIEKLRFGHHGANHPVRDLCSGRVSISSQNHNYAIVADSFPSEVAITHINLNDETVEGFVHRDLPLWSYQFHPEAAPGPHDARWVFADFVASIGGGENRRAP